MADAEQNPEETPKTPAEDQSPSKPSALDVLDRIEAEKAADAAGPEREKALESELAKADEPEPEKADEPDGEPKAEPEDSKEAQVARLKKNIVRCEEIKQEVHKHEKVIEELNRERTLLVRDIKHDRELTRPPLHELNRAQAEITRAERANRYEALETLRQLGLQPGASAVTRKPNNPHPPKFRVT